MRSKMDCASASTASRVRMSLLADRSEFPLALANGLLYPRRRRAPLHIVQREHALHGEPRVDILPELRAELPQFFQRQLLQLTSFFQAEPHRVSDPFVRQTESNATFGQIRGSSPGIQ